MEDFKTFGALLDPDERWAHFVLHDTSTNKTVPYSLQHIHDSVAKIRVSATAPEDVQSQFNVARMLCVYASLYYPFHQVAELKAFSTVEMALRHRFPNTKGGLNRLLTVAVEQSAITDAGFSHIDRKSAEANHYSKQLPHLVSSLRNTLAHGDKMLYPGSLFTVRNCAEIINQLFPEATSSTTSR